MEWTAVLAQIEDIMFPHLALSVWERAVYYHLLRQSWARGRDQAKLSVRATASGAGMSDRKAREALQALHDKGCIKIESRSRAGYAIIVYLPPELCMPQPLTEVPADFTPIDSYLAGGFVSRFLKRHNSQCFYCLRQVTRATCVLDRAAEEGDGTGLSSGPLVLSCHECAVSRQEFGADSHLRQIYRQHLLSKVEFEDRMTSLKSLRSERSVK